jgi:DNA-binding CsgD family transcriptional regulator
MKHEDAAMKKLGAAKVGALVKDDLFEKDREAAAARPDVKYLLDHLGIFDRFGVRLNNEREYFNGIVFQYDPSRGNVTEPEWQLLQPLFVHIRTAMDISRTFSLLKAKYNAILTALNRIKMSYAIVLSSGEVIVMNDSAKAVFEKNDGVYLTKANKIKATDSELTAKINHAVSSVSDTVSGFHAEASIMFTIPSKRPVEPYLMEISPLRDITRELDDFLNGALVTIIDPEEQTNINTDGLKELYGLTDSESIVADMAVSGRTNQSIADERGVSPETVKKQLESILIKTNSTNRTALVRRVLSVNLPVI